MFRLPKFLVEIPVKKMLGWWVGLGALGKIKCGAKALALCGWLHLF